MRAAVAFASAAGDEVALLGDFNARLGSVCFPVLGIHNKAVENKNGAMKLVIWSRRPHFSHWNYMDIEP